MTQSLVILAVALCACLQLPVAQIDYAGIIASLIDPAKLATLAPRGANPRVQKAVYWLAEARRNGHKPETVLDSAVVRAGIKGGLVAKLTKEALLRNLSIAEELGCLDTEGLAEMRRGKAATVRRGPYTGDQLTNSALTTSFRVWSRQNSTK